MTESEQEPRLPIAFDQIQKQLERILNSEIFRNKEKLARFLRFVVEATLAGDEARIKQYSIGVDALGYEPGDDFESTVRAHARRLRATLEKYYAGPGISDSLRIELPKGQYIPRFTDIRNVSERSAGASESAVKPVGFRGIFRSRVVLAIGIVLVAGGSVLFSRRSRDVPDYGLTQLTFYSAFAHAPSPSRDGRMIAYASDHSDDGGLDIWLKSLDSPGHDTRLTRHSADDQNPDISPDGRWVVYRSMRDGGGICRFHNRRSAQA